MLATMEGHTEVVKVLVEAGADPNATMNINQGERSITSSALMFAARGGSTEIVKLLVEAGADPHYRSADGNTARGLAERFGHLEVVEYLQQVETKNEDSNRPIRTPDKAGGGKSGDSRIIQKNAASAVGSMRLLVVCSIGYQTGHPNIGFPVDVKAMGPSGDYCIDQALVDAAMGEGEKRGYKFTYRPTKTNGNVNIGFEVTAAPIECDRTGRRTLFADDSGVVRFTNEAGCPQADVKSPPI